MAYYNKVVRPCRESTCLIWPFARSGVGYAQMRFDGRPHNVHRLVCEAEHGPPPSPEHVAAHSCGKGNVGCVNPMHLSWKTNAENEADKIIHGTCSRGERNGSARLSEKQVREVRSTKHVATQPELAAIYGVSRYTIRAIVQGRTWGHLS